MSTQILKSSIPSKRSSPPQQSTTLTMIPEYIYIPADSRLAFDVGYSFEDDSSCPSPPSCSMESKRWQATGTSTSHPGASSSKVDCPQSPRRCQCDSTVCPRQPERKISIQSTEGSTMPPKMPRRVGTPTNLSLLLDDDDDDDDNSNRTFNDNPNTYGKSNISSCRIQPNVAILSDFSPIRLPASAMICNGDIQSLSSRSRRSSDKKQERLRINSKKSSSSCARIVHSSNFELR